MAEPRKFAVVAAYLALCVIWSSTWLAIKVGLSDLPPISFVAIRFVIAIARPSRISSAASHCSRSAAAI